jgi:hypothetical protein
MGLLIRLIELLIVVGPLIGVLVAGMRALRRRQDEAQSEATGSPEHVSNNQWRVIVRTVKEHDRTDTRWLDYELDIAKLLDYPVMTDMRNPLTERFHRAKLRADLLRPAKAEDLHDDPDAASRYLDAVESYVTAFDAAESEAIRRRRKDFSSEEQQRLSRAQRSLRVAVDSAATPQERERAYSLARRELDGLVVLPERSRTAIERGIAGELDR